MEILCNGDVLIKIWWWYSQVFSQKGTNWKGAKISIDLILALHHCDLCDFAGTHDFGWWFLADLLSGHVSTIILMRKCDSKYREIYFKRAFIITQRRKIKQIRFCLGLLQDVLFTIRWDNVDFGRICGGRERDSENTAHVGRITKIVECIRIVFGLPYNYNPNLSLKMI